MRPYDQIVRARDSHVQSYFASTLIPFRKTGDIMAKTNKRKKAQKAAQKTAGAEAISRRDFIGLARKGALGIGAIGVGGYFAIRAVQGGLHERDLSRLAAGKPTVVQVHDPNCPTCNALQKEARKALKCFGECEMQYLIADIKTDEGAIFAARHGVSHVTLLLFNAEAELREVVHGLHTEDELKGIFEAHLAA